MLGLTATKGLVAEVVEEAGRDFRYQHHYGTEVCMYNEGALQSNFEGTPGKGACIVGRVLEKVRLLGIAQESKTAHVGWLGEAFTKQAVVYLRMVQENQDNGETWGYALDYANSNFQYRWDSIRPDDAILTGSL